MLKFFRKKKEETASALEFDYDSVNAGYLICSKCSGKMLLDNLAPLSTANCPNCGESNFIPLLLEKYWLFLPIGGGGVGCVYKAFDIETGKLCAIKILQEEEKKNKFVVDSFIREAEIGLEICSHPNIGTVVGYGQAEDEYYMASEFLDGERLDELVLDNGGRVDEERVLLWGLQILSALQHIYDCGYLYRDLKPQNLMVRNNGESITLFDFGLCLELGDVEYDRGDDTVEGSPQYFPPERCDFEIEDMYSEIYSLGMVLFFCLAGEPYYNADTPMELLELHVKRLTKKSVSDRIVHCNPDIAVIIDKMIKREPKERYQTYKEVYVELEKIYKMYQSCGAGEVKIWQ
jgi:eukaryotic-like serine/threonine-protein kinase